MLAHLALDCSDSDTHNAHDNKITRQMLNTKLHLQDLTLRHVYLQGLKLKSISKATH